MSHDGGDASYVSLDLGRRAIATSRSEDHE